MKKRGLLLLSSLLAVSSLLMGCQKSGKKVIGICQLIKHDALDAATRGFKDAVIEGLGEANVEFDYQEAAGDANTCITIANSFVSKKVDLIMANATPALQAAYNSTTTIPILGTSITEYGAALGLKDFDGATHQNVSGTSDLAPLDGQVEMLKDIFPSAQKVGILYCSAEANSKYQVDVVKSELTKKNLQYEEISFSDSNELPTVLRAKAASIDVLYIPTDNACASNTQIIDSICDENNLPVVAGEEGMCADCGAVTLSISYYTIGQKTGQMAVEILKNGANVGEMPIAYDTNPVKKYNPTICERLGITVPSDYTAIEIKTAAE